MREVSPESILNRARSERSEYRCVRSKQASSINTCVFGR
jgi:hypothetical protein